jgi:arylsulfatase A-like enzyme
MLVRISAAVIAILSSATTFAADAQPSARPNILMIAIDDQNDWIGCLGGHPQVKTPNIDALAARGMLFTNAHCQAPLCNPSRSSIMTGLRPSTTGIHGLAPGIRAVDATKKRETLPQHLRAAGYWAASAGKVYHDGSIKPADRAAEFDVWGPAPGMPRPPKKFVETPDKNALVDWGVFPPDDHDQADWKIADATISNLKDAPKDKPFFIACGFRLPHVPCYASQKWFDLYPEATLQLPPVKENDRDDVPEFSWYLHWKLPEPRLKWLKQVHEWRSLVRAYLASTSFMDSQVGRVLDALKQSGRLENTIVILWSDHGWHLGEKDITGKNTLWERSTHVPLIFAGPGISVGKCGAPVELLDQYPTLIELLKLPPVDGLEGHSLMPQLKDPSAKRHWPAITTHNQGNHGIRTDRWRYIHYADGSEELYDMQADPNEWTNLARDGKHVDVIAELKQWLPKVDVPAAPGSAQRVLQKGENGQWIWEGKVIDPKDRQYEGPPVPSLAELSCAHRNEPELIEYISRRNAHAAKHTLGSGRSPVTLLHHLRRRRTEREKTQRPSPGLR